MQTTELKDHDEGRPTDPRIAINPEDWGSETEPQACETPEGDWLYNKPASELFGDSVPNNEEWEQKIKEGWKPEKFSGFRTSVGQDYYHYGANQFYFSSTQSDINVHFANFSPESSSLKYIYNRGNGFSLRLKK